MFDLEKAIAEWRRQMIAAGLRNPEALDELENHLREDAANLVSAGTPQADAFQLAVARVGNARFVAKEFKINRRYGFGPVRSDSLVWMEASAALVVLLIVLLSTRFGGASSFLLAAHIVGLTAGYGVAFLAGGFGIYHVCCRWVGALPPARQQSLRRAIRLSTQLSAGLVVAGLLLGMLWSVRTRGRYLTGDPREIGAIIAAVWLIASWMIQRVGRASARAAMPLSLVGNMVVSLTWFGAGVLAHGASVGSYWPLNALLAVHLFFLGASVLRTPERAEA